MNDQEIEELIKQMDKELEGAIPSFSDFDEAMIRKSFEIPDFGKEFSDMVGNASQKTCTGEKDAHAPDPHRGG